MTSPLSVTRPVLLAIVEYGGYPDFSPLYREAGFEVVTEYSMRKAMAVIKKSPPAVIVAEFNFQTAFRDRISNLETLMAGVQRLPDTRVIVFYERDIEHQFARLKGRFDFFDSLPFPIEEPKLKQMVESLRSS